MKVLELEIEDFRCVGKSQYTFTHGRTLVLGENAVGKSTLLDAIRFVLCGRCRGLDRGGAGTAGLKRDTSGPSNYPIVKAKVEHAGKVYRLSRRVLPRGGTGAYAETRFQVEGWSGSSEDQVAAWFHLLGVTRDALAIILDGDVFFSFNHADAKTILLDLLNAQIDVPARSGESAERIGLAECEARYDAAYQARTAAGRALKALPTAAEPDEPLGDVEGVKARLQGLIDERERLVLERATSVGAAGEVAKVAKVEYQRHADELPRVQQAILALRTDEQYALELAALESDIGSIRIRLEGLPAEDSAKRTPDFLELIQSLREHTPASGCVFDRAIPCKTAAKEFVKRADALAAEMALHEMDRAKAQERAKQRVEWSTAVAERERARRALVDQRQIAQAKRQREVELLAQMERLSLQLTDDAVIQPSPLDSQIAELERRIANGRVILDKKIALQAAWALYERMTRERAEITAERAQAEQDVERYGPNGLRVAALQAAIGTFEAKANEALVAFGYRLSLSVDPWGLVVNGHAWVLLSTSEKLRVSVALQCALAQISGIGLTLIDQIELLLPGPRRLLQEIVMQAPLEHIVLAKAQPLSDRDPVIPGVQVIRVVPDLAPALAE